jgi:hypothetical protein
MEDLQMRTGLLLLALLGLSEGAAVELQVDTTVADHVLASMGTGGLTPNALFALEESETVQMVVDQGTALGLPAHVNGFLDTLDAVAAGDEPSVDLYEFQRVATLMQEIREARRGISEDPGTTAAAIEAGIGAIGRTLPESATLVLVAGAVSCAGASEDMAYVILDLRCVAESPGGISAMFAHAMIHARTAEVNYAAPTDPKMVQLDSMLTSAVRESAAAQMSDAMGLGIPAHYGAFDPAAFARNQERAVEVLTVTQALLHAAGHDHSADMATLEWLLMGGYWEAPLRWLSFNVISALAATRDADALAALIDGPPEAVFHAYAELPTTSQPLHLSHPGMEAMNALASARSGSATHMAEPGHDMP